MLVCKMKEQDTGGVRFRINGTVVPVAEIMSALMRWLAGTKAKDAV